MYNFCNAFDEINTEQALDGNSKQKESLTHLKDSDTGFCKTRSN